MVYGGSLKCLIGLLAKIDMIHSEFTEEFFQTNSILQDNNGCIECLYKLLILPVCWASIQKSIPAMDLVTTVLLLIFRFL